MKRFTAFILAVAVTLTAHAMVYMDSKILSLAEMQALGVQFDIHTLPGPKSAQCIRIVAWVLPNDPKWNFKWISFAVLEKKLDADWASTDPLKSGARDSTTWSKPLRKGNSDKPTLSFAVSEDELPRSYLVVEFDLPPRNGIGTFGRYYLPLSQLVVESNHSQEPTPGAVH